MDNPVVQLSAPQNCTPRMAATVRFMLCIFQHSKSNICTIRGGIISVAVASPPHAPAPTPMHIPASNCIPTEHCPLPYFFSSHLPVSLAGWLGELNTPLKHVHCVAFLLRQNMGMEKAGERDVCVSPAFMSLYLSQVMLLFLKSVKSWFHLLVSLGDPNLCMHLPYASESANMGCVDLPAGLMQERGTNRTQGR